MQPPRRLRPRRSTARLTPLFGSIVAVFLLVVSAPPARATFHLNEVTKVLTSYNGNATIQAVEFQMLANGENLVSGISIRSYDAAGVLLATHGTFAANLPSTGAFAGRKILCATTGFASTFGITPDLVITAGIPVSTGQVSFEKATCFVNSVAYGDVTVPKSGTTSAQAIPVGLAYVLIRALDDGTALSCPLAEDSAARFVIRSASTGSPIAFSNNAGVTVTVASTLTGVDGLVTPGAWRVYPNPFRGALRIETPRSGRVAVFDVQGALVATLSGSERGSGPQRLEWNGRDARGRRAPAGVYFIGYGEGSTRALRRVVLLR